MSNKAIYTQGSVRRHLAAAATPLFFSIFCNLIIQATDMYFISRLGGRSVTAISFCFPLIRLLIGFSLGLGIATSTIIARLIGAKQDEKAQHLAGTLLYIAIVLGVTLSFLGELLFPFPFNLLGAHQAHMLDLIHQFMEIWFITLIFQLCLFVSDFALRAYGMVKISSSLFIAASLLNLVLDPILIFGVGPIPHLGLAGSALAGLFARLTVLGFSLHYLYKKQLINFKLDLSALKSQLKDIFSYFIPASLTNLVPGVSVAFTTSLLASISTHAVAAFGIATTIQSLVLVPFFALSGGLNPFIAQNHGANHSHRATEGLQTSLWVCLVWGLLVAISLACAKDMILSHYTHDPAIIAVGEKFFDIAPLGYFAWGFVMMICAYFNATKRPFLSTLLSLSRTVIVFIPLAFLLKYLFSYEGVFSAFALANIGVALGMVWLKRREFFPRRYGAAIAQ